MPNYYKKKGNYKKSYRSRVPKWKKIMNLGQDLYQNVKGPLGYAIKGVNFMKNLINTETKYIDLQPISGVVTTTSSQAPVTAVAQGLTDITRIGNSLLCKYLMCRYLLTVNATATRNTVRLIVFIDKNNAQGTAPTAADLLQGGVILGPINVNNTDRFAILKDEMFDLYTSGQAQVSGKWYFNLNRLHIKFDGTDAAQASLAENHIYVMAISVDASNGPTVIVTSRVGFYDN